MVPDVSGSLWFCAPVASRPRTTTWAVRCAVGMEAGPWTQTPPGRSTAGLSASSRMLSLVGALGCAVQNLGIYGDPPSDDCNHHEASRKEQNLPRSLWESLATIKNDKTNRGRQVLCLQLSFSQILWAVWVGAPWDGARLPWLNPARERSVGSHVAPIRPTCSHPGTPYGAVLGPCLYGPSVGPL